MDTTEPAPGRPGGDPPGAVPPGAGGPAGPPADALARLAGSHVPYRTPGFDEADLAPAPLEQFARWLADAQAADLPEPNAMVLGTADADGVPSARTVLLKAADARGFVFFTNQGSRKGRELAANPRASALFCWLGLLRQVVVAGDVEQVPREESAAYFASRPHASRVGAWTSRQSSVIDGRAGLDARFAELSGRWPEGAEVPLPDFWGGYVLRPRTVELWQGRLSRLHDRLRFRRTDPDAPSALDDPAGWVVERLSP